MIVYKIVWMLAFNMAIQCSMAQILVGTETFVSLRLYILSFQSFPKALKIRVISRHFMFFALHLSYNIRKRWVMNGNALVLHLGRRQKIGENKYRCLKKWFNYPIVYENPFLLQKMFEIIQIFASFVDRLVCLIIKVYFKGTETKNNHGLKVSIALSGYSPTYNLRDYLTLLPNVSAFLVKSAYDLIPSSPQQANFATLQLLQQPSIEVNVKVQRHIARQQYFIDLEKVSIIGPERGQAQSVQQGAQQLQQHPQQCSALKAVEMQACQGTMIKVDTIQAQQAHEQH